MNNLLVGNGLIIEFGGADYTNSAIMLRNLENFEREDFPKEVITTEPILTKSYFGTLFKQITHIVNGEYNEFVMNSFERKSLDVFIGKYKTKDSLKIPDIGFEDYYLLHDLFCHKNNIVNPEQFEIRESLRFSFLYAIYNDGKLCEIYKKFSPKVVDMLNSYDNIFTTNYDNNIEQAIFKKVYHIHGYFFDLSDVYNINSFRNNLEDHPMENLDIDERYIYLYSTAISTHCGDYKMYDIKQSELANKTIEGFTKSYLEDVKIKSRIDSFKNHSNKLLARLYDSIQLKLKNPNKRFSEPYPFKEFSSMAGNLDIISLSPYNDLHIFDTINNSDLENITYYYFDESENSIISKKLSNKNVMFKSVRELWSVIK